MRETQFSNFANSTDLFPAHAIDPSRLQNVHALPSVSVVIPCYNYGRFLKESLESVLAQIYPPLEIIVVDDGSTDNTAVVAKSFGDKVRYIYQANRGLSGARNSGIRAAAGDWVAILDADDTWHKDKLLLQMQYAAANPDTVLIGAVSTHNLAQIRTYELFSEVYTQDLLGALPFGASSAAAKRSALLTAGLFDETKRQVEDRDMWLKLSLIGKVARVNLPLWTYRFHDGQMINNSRRMADGYLKVLDDFFAAHPEFRSLAPTAYAYCHYDSAVSYFENGSRWHGLRHAVRSLCCSVKPLKQRFARGKPSRILTIIKCLSPGPVFKAGLAVGKLARRIVRPQSLKAGDKGSASSR
jgi:glycosyltransferase involved in cell wall biosynthesis